MLKLVHILHINIAPITTKDNIKVRSKLTKPHYMKIHFSHGIVVRITGVSESLSRMFGH